MIEIKKIIYIYEDHREIEKPEFLSFTSKERMETYRSFLLRTKNASSVFFTYEEH